MEFKTVADAFNYYRGATLEQIEARAVAIKNIIDTDPNADIDSLNIEIGGLQQAKQNAKEKQQEQRTVFNPITGVIFDNPATQPPATGDDLFSSVEYRNAFYKTMLGHQLTISEQAIYKRAAEEKRADAFSTSTNSAAIIPTQTLDEVVSKARTQGGLISVCRSFSIPANVSIPVGTPSGAAQWHTEGADTDREKANITNVTFNAHEILKVFSISAKVKRMSVSAFESYLVDELNACVMSTIANSLVNGSGNNQGKGVLPGVTWDASNSFKYATTGIKYTDITKLVAMLARGYSQGGGFAMNNATLYNQIYSISDDSKRPIFTQDPRSELIGRLLGFPVTIDDFIPVGTVLFGNFYYLGYNLPEGIAIERSDQSGFTKGLIDYRAMAIADTQPIVPEAFTKLEPSS